MKKYFWQVWLLLAIATLALSQSPTPQLSTADKIAIQQCEQAKQAAQKAFTEAQQQELSVLREWQAGHPGFKIDPQTFQVESDKAPAKVEPQGKK